MNLFGIEKISIGECQKLTIQALNTHAYHHRHWVIAWSGGKDSSATMTLILYLILSGQIQQPETLTVMYADTRMELPPLSISAQAMIAKISLLSEQYRWLSVRKVMAEIDKRFFVYILGKGVPPPNNNTLRWCTRQIKLDPMQAAIEERFGEVGEKVLTITGVRMGESAIRDGRISMSCSKDGAECGQGWYQNTLSDKLTAKLAPIIHWRVCNVWDWLKIFAPSSKYGAWDTEILAQAYGGDHATEVNARTGCIGCPLASKDTALDSVMFLFPEKWGYLAPLKKLKLIYREMRKGDYRLRKVGEKKKDGNYSANPNRMGPLTIEARKKFLKQIVSVQEEVNAMAVAQSRPEIDIINQEEIGRIKWHWENNIWPNGWDGMEQIATELHDTVYSDGSIQRNLFK